MKTKRVLVGMLACLGMTAGLSAATLCPPEEGSAGDGAASIQARLATPDNAHALVARLVKLADGAGADAHQLVLQLDGDLSSIANLKELKDLHVDLKSLPDLQPLEITLDQLPAKFRTFALNLDGGGAAPVAGHFHVTAQPEGKARARVITKSSKGDDDGKSNIVIEQDDNTISVTMENGKVTSVERNGKKVPLDQVKKDGDHVTIQDKNGKAVFEFNMNDNGADASNQAGPHWQVYSNGQGQGPVTMVMPQVEPPKAMIGVQLGDPDAMLLGHFGLEAGDATLVTGVYEDLPAGEAGIKPYDIIIGVDGHKPAGQAELREALRGKDAGDKVTLTIIHKGEKKDVKVKLVRYDQEALEKSKLDAVDMNAFSVTQGAPGNVFMAPGIGQMRNFQGMDPDAAKGLADTWRKQAEEWAQKFKDDPAFKDALRLHLDHSSPDAQQAPAPGANQRWEKLEERLDRLEKMIERLAEQQQGDAKPHNR